MEQIDRIQTSIERGESNAFAAMRGGGKTSEVRCAALWALLYGRCRYVVVIGANLNVLGEVKGDAVAILGDVLVEGYVHGSAVAPFGEVTIGSSP